MGGYSIARLLRLASNLLLAHMLFPEAFGLMALVNIVVVGLTMLSDVGLVPGIVQSRRGDDPIFLDTAWSIQIGRGFVLWIAAWLLARPLADFYAQPELARLLPVAALGIVFAGFNSMALASFRRHLKLGRLTVLEIAPQLAGIVVMVGWAYYQRSVWALVAGSLTGACLRTLVSHAMSDRRDHLCWNPEAARELLHFGKWIFLSTLVAFLSTQLDRLIFAKMIPLGQLGVYGIAAMFATIPIEILSRLGSSVVFPAFSRKLEGSDLGSSYRRARLPLLAVSGLTVAPLAAAGIPLIETLYDLRYAEAGWILQVLAAGAWFQALEVAPSCALLALGRPQWIAASHSAKVAGIALFVALGSWIGGFPGAVIGFASSNVLLYLTAALGAWLHGLGGFREDLMASAALVVAVACGLYVSSEFAHIGTGSVAQLVAGATVPLLLWAGAVYLLLRRRGEQLRSLLFVSPASPR